MNTGWICPRCERVWAPNVSRCDCSGGNLVGVPAAPVPPRDQIRRLEERYRELLEEGFKSVYRVVPSTTAGAVTFVSSSDSRLDSVTTNPWAYRFPDWGETA